MDIDIDIADRDELLKFIKHIPASIHKGETVTKHNTGVYLQSVPWDWTKNLCTLDYEQAEDAGYFKIDVLNVHLYKQVKDEGHLNRLLATEPLWELLEHEDIVDQLTHLNGNYDVVSRLKPRSILELAACLAIIRPSKRYLLGKDWATILSEVWTAPSDGSYYFKKAHALAYAHLVVVHMNLLVEQSS
jgi:hypothetical protein